MRRRGWRLTLLGLGLLGLTGPVSEPPVPSGWRPCRLGEQGYWAVQPTPQGVRLWLAEVVEPTTAEQLQCVVPADARLTISTLARRVQTTSCLLDGWLYAGTREAEVQIETSRPPGCADVLRLVRRGYP